VSTCRNVVWKPTRNLWAHRVPASNSPENKLLAFDGRFGARFFGAPSMGAILEVEVLP
jgi:hypothetical protein